MGNTDLENFQKLLILGLLDSKDQAHQLCVFTHYVEAGSPLFPDEQLNSESCTCTVFEHRS